MRLDLQDLAFGYAHREVGRDVTFSLSGGEVLCLLGPNGGGKTTLFKTVLRLLAPHGGRIFVDGESITGWSRARLARAFAYVPQAQLGVFPFTVADTVLMGRTAHLGAFATPSRGDRAIALEMLGVLGISHLAARPYTEISGGERQLTFAPAHASPELTSSRLRDGPQLFFTAFDQGLRDLGWFEFHS